jgi:hypothetical protein
LGSCANGDDGDDVREKALVMEIVKTFALYN